MDYRNLLHSAANNLHTSGYPKGSGLGNSRRSFLHTVMAQAAFWAGGSSIAPLCFQSGCTGNPHSSDPFQSDLVIGQRGFANGRFQCPRAIAIDPNDQIYVVDKTGRIQRFDSDGKYVLGWRTPAIENGKPTGLSIDRDGSVMVSDTHYYRFLFYTPEGEPIQERTIGGVNGPDPGQFAFVTDIVRASSGEFFCGEYGEYDRIHRYAADGRYIDRMGEHGDGPLQFSRPQSLNVDQNGLLWVADSCNHRIQVIDWREAKPRSVSMIGSRGNGPGQFQFPYGLVLARDGSIIVSEFGNHRVQHLTSDGTPIAVWGSAGSEPGQLNEPWASAIDSKNRIYVVDSKNNRVQRFRW
ncbi:MAG: hypothetical protein ABL921_18000 [Pirellula sp.]